MKTWDDIYDSSDKILKSILEQKGEEWQLDGGASPDKLNNRLQQQFQYNPFLAYQKLKKHRYRRLMRWYGMAASMVLIVGFAWGWLQQGADREQLLTETICPGNKKAVLSLADGSVWYLGDTVMTILTAREDIRVDSNGLSLHTHNQTAGNNDEVCHLLTIPRGGEFAMTLPDGSRVWLNSESELRFPLHFAANERKVALTGEAYFEIEKDSAHPFIVETNNSEIEVLGTDFNVRSYRNEKRVVTTLVEGSVCVKNTNNRILLKPGEQSILDETGRLWKQQVEVYPYVAWKEGRFVFRKQRLEDIMATVSRWYNIQVQFEDEEVKDITFSGGMMRYEGFEVFVKMIEAIGSVTCDIKEKVVFIAKHR